MSKNKKDTDNNQYQQRIIDLNVNGHLMSLDKGLYCIYHMPNQVPADEFGFPGLRISVPPFKQNAVVEIETFEKDGWLGAEKNAVLVRVSGEAGLILVTVYRNPANQHPAPQLQVIRLNDVPDQVRTEVKSASADAKISMSQMTELAEKVSEQSSHAAEQQQEAVAQENKMRVVAHVQRMGDVSVDLGDWVGIPDSKTWIEGFGIALDDRLQPEDIEYQAVLGKGWLSPWYKGNQFCGSRGMALPLCGLRVRLNEEAAKKFKITLQASFIDGTKLGPVDDDTTLSSESVAPLEAICFQLVEKNKRHKTETDEKQSQSLSGKTKNMITKTSISKTNVRTKKITAKDAVLQAAKKQSAKRTKTSDK